MKSSKLLALGVVLALSCPFSIAALADGMPFKEKESAPPPAKQTSLDKAIDEIQNKQPAAEAAPQTAPPPALVAPQQEPPAPVAVAPAAAPPVPEARTVEVQPDSSFFGLSVGMYDPFTHGQQAAAFNVQWEPGVKIAGTLQPLFGALVTTNGALMGYGGIGIPFMLTDHVRLMPSVAVGAYHGGGGVDLHQVLAWRAGAELAYVFDDKSRLGLSAHVLTNGSFNPDGRTEVIGITYTAPFELFSGSAKSADAVMSTAGQKP